VVATVAPLVLPVALLGFVPVAIVNVRNNRARYRLELELTELERERTYIEYLLTTRADAKEVRAFGLGRTLLGWHADLWDVRTDRLRTLIRKRLRLSGVGSIVTTLVLVATLAMALLLAAEGTLTLGDAAVAIVGLQQLSGRLQGAGVAAGSVHEGVVFLRDFEEFRAALPDIRGRRSTGLPPSPPASIRVEHVAYRYPGASTDAVADVSFELRRGQVLAIVGSNGSGKSTLAKLLCGLIAPSRGSISWDGVDLATCDPDLVRREVAPVFQDFTRFMFSVREVISLGDVDRVGDEEGLLRAAQLSGVDEVIAAHPEGLDVRLGTLFFAGTDLSGGQWQRLAVARALFRGAPIVVMDEPSASLDPLAEAQLFDVLRDLASDRMVVFVSHRFATVRSADVVMVMERGAVVEIGPHEELMRSGGLYRDLFDVQAARYGFTSSGAGADHHIAADLGSADYVEHPARLDQTETSTQ
jgi:ATP-binding cassette, subfamily B, bacterial